MQKITWKIYIANTNDGGYHCVAVNNLTICNKLKKKLRSDIIEIPMLNFWCL
jgi:hypothetical protein